MKIGDLVRLSHRDGLTEYVGVLLDLKQQQGECEDFVYVVVLAEKSEPGLFSERSWKSEVVNENW